MQFYSSFTFIVIIISGDGTWDVVAVVFDVHLMQTSLSWGVFHSHGAVLVVGDVRTGGSTRGHPHFTWRRQQKGSMIPTVDI